MVDQAVEVESVPAAGGGYLPSARRFSPADFSQSESPLIEGDLAREVLAEQRELVAPVGEAAR